jgi:23S rRNA (cytidine1920-2'-O)/16S rRNA (cytidine1409-2'-O)-methyltransferase
MSEKPIKMQPVSRAKEKLDYAIKEFNLNLKNKVCADFGSSTGGFVQATLEQNPKTIYSVETSKNRLHFVLKDSPKVIVLDQTNAVHVTLPEKVDFISIDVGWTKQSLIIPNAIKNLKDNGIILTLVKPHYEAGKSLADASDKEIETTLEKVRKEIFPYIKITKETESPIRGLKAGNREFLWLCEKKNKNKSR